MFAVVACSRCKRALVVEEGRKQAACAHCSRTLDLPNLRAFHRTEDPEDARLMVGAVNAKLAGRDREFQAAFVPPPPRPERHDDKWHKAAAAARRATSEKDRADAVARALESFAPEDFAKALRLAGLDASKAEAHLKRMLETQVVFEPRPLCYRAL